MQAANPPAPAAPASDRVARAARRAGRLLGRLDLLTARIRPWMVLAPLVVLGWVVMVYVGHIARHNGWLYYDSGDGSWYYTTAWQLGHGRLPAGVIGYGYSMAVAPLARIGGANELAGLPYIVAFNALVLSPIALLCVYGLARMIAGVRYAYVVAGIWVIAPVLAIRYFLADYHFRYVTQTLPAVLGLTPLGDFPSMVCLLVAAFFTFRAILDGRNVDALAAGLAAGLALAVKPANGAFLAAPFLALALARRGRPLVFLAAGLVPSVVCLTAWKLRGLGYVPLFQSHPQALAAGTGSLPVGLTVHAGHYLPFSSERFWRNIDGFREFTWSRRMIEWAVLAGVIALGRRSVAGAALLGVWLASYLVLKGGSVADFYGGGFFRYLAPAFPAAFLLTMSLPLLLPIAGRRLAAFGNTAGWPSSARARRGVVGAGLTLSIVPLVAILVLGLQTAPTSAAFPYASQFVPANQFALRSVQHGRAVTLSWPSQSARGAVVQYGVYRSRTDLLHCSEPSSHALLCSYPNNPTRIVSSPRLTDRPGSGHWVYRVVAQSGTTPSTGNNLLLSRALAVDVPR